MLSQRLQLRVAQKQVLTPSLVQLVTVLQLNRLELKEMISQEIEANPVLDETLEAGEELSAQEIQEILERERVAEPSDKAVLEALSGPVEIDPDVEPPAPDAEPVEPKPATDPFDEIDFDASFQEYLDPGYKSPASESVDKPSWETFVSSPVTLPDHLYSQLSLMILAEPVREAADAIVGNLDENGYLTLGLEELAESTEHNFAELAEALKAVQSCEPAGVAARDLRECLLLQVASRNGEGGVAWRILSDHMKLLETKQMRELAKAMGRPPEHLQIAIGVIRHLDPYPGLRYSGAGARAVEPDIYIFKDGDNWIIEMNDDDMPQLRLNRDYLRMLDRDQQPDKEIRNYVKERFQSASQLMKNIEQRKQTIMKTCQAVVRRQTEFLDQGMDYLRPMMIKEVAEEIGVHPSTVSRAVASKYAHTPQGVYELRFFFSEAVQGPSGSSTPLLLLKRRVKQIIGEEDTSRPLTDEQITAKLQSEGIEVTRRTVAKYREDLKIPSTHQRRVRD